MKTQNPLIGRSSGSFASSIFQTQYGTNIVRSKPVEVRNPNTSGQQLTRARMTAVVSLLKSLYSFFNITGWSSSLKKPWFSFLTGYILNNSVTGTAENVVIDYSNICPCPDPHNISPGITFNTAIQNQLTVNWESSEFVDLTSNDYLLLAIIDHTTGQVFVNTTGVQAGEDTYTFSSQDLDNSHTFTVIIRPKIRVTKYKPGADLSDKVSA